MCFLQSLGFKGNGGEIVHKKTLRDLSLCHQVGFSSVPEYSEECRFFFLVIKAPFGHQNECEAN